MYTVFLSERPTGDVTVTPTSSNEMVATVSPPSLAFSTSNWNLPQTVTVTGVDDATENEPERSATISHRAEGGGYGNVPMVSVTVTATDDDMASVNTAISPPTSIDEAGGIFTYQVSLGSKPTADVTVTPMSEDGTLVTLSPEELTFTPENWNVSQTVTVTAVDNSVDNPNTGEMNQHSVTISHGVESDDEVYNGLSSDNISQVQVVIRDDDTVGVTLSTLELEVSEAAGTQTYTVVLNSQPSDEVRVTPATSDPGVATVSDELTFTPTTGTSPSP